MPSPSSKANLFEQVLHLVDESHSSQLARQLLHVLLLATKVFEGQAARQDSPITRMLEILARKGLSASHGPHLNMLGQVLQPDGHGKHMYGGGTGRPSYT